MHISLKAAPLAGGDTLTFYYEDTAVLGGDDVVMVLHTRNFEGIAGLQFTVQFDPNLLEFEDIEGTNPALGLSMGSFGLNFTSRGQVLFSFFNAISGGVTLPDDSSVFSLRFKVIGEPGRLCPVNIGDIPLFVQAVNGNNELIPVCLDNGLIEIREPAGFTVYHRSCRSQNTAPTGSITFEAWGGMSPYNIQYTYVDSPMLAGNFQLESPGDIETIDALPPGSYALLSIDGNGTLKLDTARVVAADSLFFELDLMGPSCAGRDDAEISINDLQGWAGPLYTKWPDGQLFETEMDGFSAGTYQLRILDRLGCSQDVEFIFEDPFIDIETSVVDETCLGDGDGVLFWEINGTNPFEDTTFQLDFEGFSERTRNDALGNLEAGSYPLTVTDMNDCQILDTFIVSEGRQLTIESFVTTPVGCAGDSNGRAEIILSENMGVILPLDFSFTPKIGEAETIDNQLSFSQLPAGSYSLTIIDNDSLGCRLDTSFTLQNPDVLSVTDTAISFSCNPGNDGRIELTITGGVPFIGSAEDYLVEWNTGATGAVLSNLNSGTYIYQVTDSAGCTAGDTVVLEDLNFPAITGFIATELSCFEPEMGSVTAQLREGTAPITDIVWSTGDTTRTITDLGEGSYSLMIRDANNCVDMDSVVLRIPEDPTIILEELLPNGCLEVAQGRITIGIDTVSEGLVDINWSNGPGTLTNENLDVGEYTVTITDSKGCTDTATYEITEAMPPILMVDSIGANCQNAFEVFVRLIAEPGGYGIESIIWADTSMGNENFVDRDDNIEAIAVDLGGCRDTLVAPLPEPEEILLFLNSTPDTNGMGTGAAFASANGVPPLSFSWNTDPPSTNAIVTGLTTGSYTVTVTDGLGCFIIDSVNVDNVVPVFDIPEGGEITVFPNPFSSEFVLQVHLPISREFTARVYNINGKLMAEQVIEGESRMNVTFNTENWASGTYVLQCLGSHWETNFVLMKN
jgi:hypothetical protein